MITKETIDSFLSNKNIALFGASRNKSKFGNALLKTLKEKDYNVFLIHPNADNINGVQCYRDLDSVPVKISAALFNIKPAETEKMLRKAAEAGVKTVWMQQGSQSKDAIEFCRQNEISEVHGHCLLMYLEGEKLPHNIHRFFVHLFGKYPK